MNSDVEKDAIAKDPTAIGVFHDDPEQFSQLKDEAEEKTPDNDTAKVREEMSKGKVMTLGEVEEGTASDSTIADPTILGPDRD